MHGMDTSNPNAPKIIHAFMSRKTAGYTIKETWDVLGMRALTWRGETAMGDDYTVEEIPADLVAKATEYRQKFGKDSTLVRYPRGLQWLPNVRREDYRHFNLTGTIARGETGPTVQELPKYEHLANLTAATYRHVGIAHTVGNTARQTPPPPPSLRPSAHPTWRSRRGR